MIPYNSLLLRAVFFALLCIGNLAHANPPDPDTEQLILDLELKATAKPVSETAHWKKPQNIVVYLPGNRPVMRGDFEAWMQSAAGNAKLIYVRNRDELTAVKEDADVMLGYCFDVTPDMHELTWVQNYFVGIDRCTDNAQLQTGKVLLTNTKAIPGPGMAEHAIGMMLMLTHKLDVYHQQQWQGKWKRIDNASEKVMELGGKTLLVVGLGGIGRQVAKRAHALGMHVIATRRSSRQGPDYVETVGLPDELLKLAAQADVVVNITPLTSETKGLFDREFFQTMKPSAYFINIGRGKSVVTDDLLVALNQGEIAGAGLDVTDPEPLPEGHPLWKIPNVIITPHSSSPSDRMTQRFWLLVRENLRRYTHGEPMLNVVDIRRGY